jgi:TetR/AcrR family transcriptional repressor of nem operon
MANKISLKEKIIIESLKLFSLKGYLSTTIDDILREVHASKGGFYNHFKSKEELFFEVLSEARKIWRERCLAGLERIEDPLGKVIKLLENYKDRYLKDYERFPGGCIFVTLSVELDDQRPHLAHELNKGFIRLKLMINRFFEQAKENGQLKKGTDAGALAEIVVSGMLGASVMYGTDKSIKNLDHTINSLINYLRNI